MKSKKSGQILRGNDSNLENISKLDKTSQRYYDALSSTHTPEDVIQYYLAREYNNRKGGRFR